MTPTLNDHVKHAKQLMDKAVEAVKREFSTVRTGKATTALLDLVRVEAYGNDMPLTQVASVGNIIRIPRPPLTQERRKELVKGVHKFAEEGRVAIRHARTETLNKIKKTEHVSSDDQKHSEKEVQKAHDDH